MGRTGEPRASVLTYDASGLTLSVAAATSSGKINMRLSKHRCAESPEANNRVT